MRSNDSAIIVGPNSCRFKGAFDILYSEDLIANRMKNRKELCLRNIITKRIIQKIIVESLFLLISKCFL